MPVTAEEAGLTFDQLEGGARERALEDAVQYNHTALDWEYFRDNLQNDLEYLGLGEVKIENVAPEDARYGCTAALTGGATLGYFMGMRNDDPETYRDCAVTPQGVQKVAPLTFELMLATGEPVPYVSLSPNHNDYSTTLALDDVHQLEEYLEEHFLADLGLPHDEDLISELQDRLYEERQALAAYLNAWLGKLTRALWNTFRADIDYQYSETGLKETMYLSEGLFTPDGEFLQYAH